MSRHLTVQQLSSALDGALTGPSLEVVVRHLAVCADCRERQSRLVRHDDVLRRLLSPEAGEAFLEALGSRAEDIAVAIAHGTKPPPMATTVPLLHEEDPYESSEPPMDPALGLDRLVAQEGGYGRIGMKPSGSTQPPEVDPAEARRWLETLESGTPPEPNAFTSPVTPAHDDDAFELPSWMADPAARPTAAPAPGREPQFLRLVPTPEETPADYGMTPEDPRDDPYTHRSLMPITMSDPHATRHPGSPAYSAPPPPAMYAQAPDDPAAYEPPPARTPPETGYATRGSAIAAARRRAQEEARTRGLQRHWLFAVASVCVLLLIVLALQLTPAKDKVVAKDAVPPAAPATPDVHSAASPIPVDQVVPMAPRDVPMDTTDVFAEDTPEDSTGTEPE